MNCLNQGFSLFHYTTEFYATIQHKLVQNCEKGGKKEYSVFILFYFFFVTPFMWLAMHKIQCKQMASPNWQMKSISE